MALTTLHFTLVVSYSPILTDDNLWPSAFAKAQCAAVRITRRVNMEPVQGYAMLPVLISGWWKIEGESSWETEDQVTLVYALLNPILAINGKAPSPR